MADTFYYDTLKKRVERYKAEGNTLPAVSENWSEEKTILSEGRSEDGKHFFCIRTLQHNGWIAVNTYYEDGSTSETYEK